VLEYLFSRLLFSSAPGKFDRRRDDCFVKLWAANERRIRGCCPFKDDGVITHAYNIALIITLFSRDN